jgi:hypothetical protein
MSEEEEKAQEEKSVALAITQAIATLRAPGKPTAVKTAGYLAGVVGAIVGLTIGVVSNCAAPIALALFGVCLLSAQQGGRFYAMRIVRRSSEPTWEQITLLTEDLISVGVRRDWAPAIAKEVAIQAPHMAAKPRELLARLPPEAFHKPPHEPELAQVNRRLRKRGESEGA